MKDNDEKINELDASTRATSIKSEIDTIHLQRFHLRKQLKRHGCFSPSITRPTTEPITLNIALSHNRIEQAVRGGDYKAVVTVHPPSTITITPPLPEQPQDQKSSTLNKEEWEIVRIVDKKRKGKDYKYKVC